MNSRNDVMGGSDGLSMTSPCHRGQTSLCGSTTRNSIEHGDTCKALHRAVLVIRACGGIHIHGSSAARGLNHASRARPSDYGTRLGDGTRRYRLHRAIRVDPTLSLEHLPSCTMRFGQ